MSNSGYPDQQSPGVAPRAAMGNHYVDHKQIHRESKIWYEGIQNHERLLTR